MTALKIGVAAFVLCALALLGACKGDKQGITSSNPAPTNTSNTMLNTQDGRISDTSDRTDNGLVGDIVSDISGAISDVITTTVR